MTWGCRYRVISQERLSKANNYRLLESKILVAKAQILQSRCSVSALVSALVALFGRNPVVHGGTGEARGVGGWVPDPPGHAKPGYALENESPARRSAGGCQVVGAGPRPPGLGRNWAQTEAQGGWWGPGSAAGGGAAAIGYLFKPHNIKVM